MRTTAFVSLILVAFPAFAYGTSTSLVADRASSLGHADMGLYTRDAIIVVDTSAAQLQVAFNQNLTPSVDPLTSTLPPSHFAAALVLSIAFAAASAFLLSANISPLLEDFKFSGFCSLVGHSSWTSSTNRATVSKASPSEQMQSFNHLIVGIAFRARAVKQLAAPLQPPTSQQPTAHIAAAVRLQMPTITLTPASDEIIESDAPADLPSVVFSPSLFDRPIKNAAPITVAVSTQTQRTASPLGNRTISTAPRGELRARISSPLARFAVPTATRDAPMPPMSPPSPQAPSSPLTPIPPHLRSLRPAQNLAREVTKRNMLRRVREADAKRAAQAPPSHPFAVAPLRVALPAHPRMAAAPVLHPFAPSAPAAPRQPPTMQPLALPKLAMLKINTTL